MKMEQCSEMLAYKIQTLGNYPEESIQKMLVIIDTCDIPKLLKYASQILIITIQQWDITVRKEILIFFLNKELNIPDVFNVIWAKKLRNFTMYL